MDSRVVHSQANEYDEHHHPHNVVSQQVAHGAESQHQHDHEKMSVLKKVKAKAKKIKDTIKRHGHYDHDHEYHYEDKHIPDDHSVDEEDDKQEEIAQDPEVHGAPIYDSATLKSTIPGQVENLGQPRVNFGSTTVEEERHHEPRIVVVSPTTESDQIRAAEPARTFVGEEEKSEQRQVNLERPMGLEEDPHAPGSRPEARTPSNYQAKVTDPTGAGTGEIDITPIQNSFARINVQDEAIANPEPKVRPTAAETYPSTRSRDQFSSEMSTATKIHGQFAPELTPTNPNKSFENLQAEPKILSSAVDTQHPSIGSQNKFFPEISTANTTEYPSAGSHDQFASEPIPTKLNKFPATLEAEPQVLPIAANANTQHPFAGSHGQFLPEMSTSAKTQYPSAERYDQLAPEPTPKISNTFPEDLQAEPKVLPTAVDTQYPSARSHDQFLPEACTTNETQYPSSGSHGQFAPEPITTNPGKFQENHQASGQALDTTTRAVEQPRCESTEKPSNQISYTDKISSAKSAIADKAVSAKNAVASKLGYDEKGDTDRDENETRHEEYKSGEKPSNQSSYTDKISSATSAIADKAVSAKNAVASKLGYDEKGDTDRDENETRHEEYKIGEKPSNQSSYTQKISSATPAIADKAVSAKNVVASKLGYDEKGDTDREENETRHEEYKSGEKPSNQSSYTQKISSATPAIADKAVSAKNVVASKLGYDEKVDGDENETRQEEYRSGEKPSNKSNYTEKISSATSAIADKAVSAKNVVASKLGYDEKVDGDENETRQDRSGEKPSNQSNYTEKISSATSAIADKAVSAKNVVASKLGYDEKVDGDENETRQEEYRSGEKPSNQSNYTQKISSATSAIADKAVSAKNIVTSKLGYGEKGDGDDKVTTSEVHKSGDAPSVTGSSAGYGQKIALSLTEKLAPVCGRVAGAGSAVMSKVPGTGTGASNGTTTEAESGVPVQDKGISVKDYLAEKLRPGDEDRALSEVISDTLHKRKEEPAKTLGDDDRTADEVISDAIHKQEEEPEQAEHRHLGKVIESEEEERRLGTGNEKSDKGPEESYVHSPRKGVVGKLKDAVGSWFGKPGDSQSSQVADGESLSKNIDGEAGHVSGGVEERRPPGVI